MNFSFALGFDIHELVEGRPLKLCGIEIPFKKGLLGHSDGDVGLHAIIDGMLSAAGLPDIGTIFPDTDPTYKDVDSIELLKVAFCRVKEEGFRIVKIDLTFICDEPKLSSFYQQMKENLSKLLELSVSAISIKAKRTENLIWKEGKEAIACLCLVVLEKI